MKKLLLISLSILIANLCNSQNLSLAWALHSGGTGIDQVYSITSDLNGDIYTVGYFEDTVDFDPSSGVYNLISEGSSDMFIQKLDNNGNLLWAKSIGGVGLDRAFGASLDINEDLLITGFFNDTVDFDPDTGKFNLVSNGSLDLFILKLNANGSFSWALSIGDQSSEVGFSIYCESNGNIIVTGSFQQTVDFDPDTSVYDIKSKGNQDVFVLKLDSNGSFLWAYAVGGGSSDAGREISVDSQGNIYTVGYSTIGADFDPGPGITYLHSFQNSADIYLLKLSSSGNFLWVRGLMGLSSFDRPYDVKVDLNSNVYLTGCFLGTIDFDPSSTGTFNLSSSGSEDIFIQKLDSSGNFLWAKSMGSSGDDQGFALAIDDSSNIYTSGYFEGTVDFDPDTVDTFNLISNGGEDIFIQKLDSSGNFLWAESFGGTGFDQTRSILVNEKGNIYATGYFEATVDFDPDTTNSFNLSSNGGKDHFILKLNQCLNSFDTLNAASCFGYISPSGKIWNQSGTYSDTISNSTGCDSILSIKLTITAIDTSLTLVNHVKITANDSLADYQWIECSTGPIVGDTNRSFVATANGTYAVILTNNGCIDTSACVNILSVGVVESTPKSSSIRFYPNPNIGIFTLEVDKSMTSKAFQIYDTRGRLVKEAHITNNKTRIDICQFGKGIYFIINSEFGISEKLVVY